MTDKKSTNPLVYVGIGCLALIVIIGIISTIAFKFFAKKIGTGLVQSVIESKTGVKTNLQDLEKGKMTFTDEKTGTTIDVGSTKIPDSFPKDFPIYSGMKLVSSLTGEKNLKGAGYWLTFSSTDSFDKINAYYTSELPKNGWKESASYAAGGTSTKTVTKGALSGTLSITREDNTKETQVLIMLGTENTPVEEP